MNIHSFYDSITGTWSYIVWGKESNQCAVIDSVLDFDLESGRTSHRSLDPIRACLKKYKLSLQWILETHIHADHLTGASILKGEFGGKIGVSTAFKEVLQTWEPILNLKDDLPLDGSQFDHFFEDGETFTIGNLEAQYFSAPGHTPADGIFKIEDSLFVGDVLLMPDIGSGRCDFPGGSAENSYTSIQKVLSFPEHYTVHIGHDYPPGSRAPSEAATVGYHRAHNVRISGTDRESFISKRKADDQSKPVPKLLLPSIQVNLRAGQLGDSITIPVNKL